MLEKWKSVVWSFALVGCGEVSSPEESVPDPPVAASPGVDGFWRAFRAGEVEAAPQAIALLDEDADLEPEQSYPVLLRGLARFWILAEAGRSGVFPPDAVDLSLGAIEDFEKARELSPSDARIDGWHGGMLVQVGRAIGSADLLDQGLAELDRSAVAHPSVALFTTFGLFENDPVGSTEFARATDAFWQLADLCADGHLDRSNPDMRPFIDDLPHSWCGNPAVAPHSYEGFWSRGGDLMVKDGNLSAAAVLYANATLMDIETWPYRAMLDQKIATIEQRAELYADADRSNDPPLGSADAFCATCHAEGGG